MTKNYLKHLKWTFLTRFTPKRPKNHFFDPKNEYFTPKTTFKKPLHRKAPKTKPKQVSKHTKFQKWRLGGGWEVSQTNSPTKCPQSSPKRFPKSLPKQFPNSSPQTKTKNKSRKNSPNKLRSNPDWVHAGIICVSLGKSVRQFWRLFHRPRACRQSLFSICCSTSSSSEWISEELGLHKVFPVFETASFSE